MRDGTRDDLIREEPLRIEIDDSRLITMRTPGQDEDFITGFLLSEGMVASLDEVLSIDIRRGRPRGEPRPDDQPGIEADVVRVRLSSEAEAGTLPRRTLTRVHEMRPSCGLCGIEDLDEILSARPLRAAEPRFDVTRLAAVLDAFGTRQLNFARTGACHAGAIVRAQDERFLGFGEDVGRHNAIDKAIGMAARAGGDFAACLGVLSGRAGYELVAKLLRVGVPIIVSVSAPTALSFDLCREAGATLVGFARGGAAKVYWDEGRLRSAT